MIDHQSENSREVHFSTEEDAYVLELELTEEGLKQWGEEYQKLKEKLEPSWEEIGIPSGKASAQLAQLNRRILIDKKTLVPKQIDHVTIWEMPLAKGSVTFEQNMVMTYAGESAETITVPLEIKESARER